MSMTGKRRGVGRGHLSPELFDFDVIKPRIVGSMFSFSEWFGWQIFSWYRWGPKFRNFVLALLGKVEEHSVYSSK